MRAFITSAAAIAVALAVSAGPAAAQDHEECYQIKDPAKIKGVVDLTPSLFGLEPGCKLGPAKWFCSPASKTVISVTANKVPIAPLPVYGPAAPVPRLCYKVKCPIPNPDQNVTDQFGNRTVQKLKASFLCTPAVMGPGYCGNGVIDPGEACDGLALGACTTGCRSNCSCTCETACCYIESPPLAPPKPAPDAECFEYSGNPAQVAAFVGTCTGTGGPAFGVPGSLAPPFLVNSAFGAFPGGCAGGPPAPIFGTPCIPGPPGAGNIHVIPSDSTCP